jgi:hypothetical protein
MAIFSGKIIEAYYANPDNDTVEVIYNEGDKALLCYVPVDNENDLYKALIKEYSSEQISQSTLNRNKLYAKQVRDLVFAQKTALVNQKHKTNIEDFVNILINFNGDIKEHLDVMFQLKVRIFEQDTIKKSSNKELKSKIRTSKTPLEILYYYKELMND